MKKLIGMTMTIIIMIATFQLPIDVHAADSTVDGKGLLGEFYKVEPNPDDREDINVFDFDDFRGERAVANLNGDSFVSVFNELSGTPDYNTARFTGTIVPEYTEDYTFFMEGDDGFRLWIDGELVIDFWEQKWEVEQTSTSISLEAGKHYDIKVEYLQGWGGSWLRMDWESTSQEREVVPESALYLPLEHIIQTEKSDLAGEIQKTEYLTANFADNVTEELLDEIIATKNNAEELLNTIDEQEISDRDKADVIIAMTKSLSTTRSNFMKAMGVQSSSVHDKFNNPLYQGQDPFVTYKDGFYYFVSSSNLDSNNKVYVSKSRTLTDQGEKVMVFDSKGTQTRIFAPEILFFDGKWYIYYCADLEEYDYKHMATVLESVTDDPQGEYVDKGALYLGENGEYKQANDFTVFESDGQLYGVWGTLGAGEPAGPAIVPMDNPYTITEDRSFLPGDGGEGPRVLQKDGNVFITLSEGDYQSDGYRLSYYMNTNGDFLNEDSWTRKNDVFVATDEVSGPARAGFVKSADGKEDWMIYHSRVYKDTSRNWWRQVNIKQFGWNEDGTPDFGEPVSPYQWQDLPSGDLGQGDMYQAETAIHYGNITTDNSKQNYQGTGYIHLPNEPSAEASFVVNAEEAGDYIVGVRYAYGVAVEGESTSHPTTQLPARAKINVFVNGVQVKTITPDKTAVSWEEWFTASERLSLEAGENVISYRIDEDSIGNVNVDYLTMYKADVPNPVAVTSLNITSKDNVIEIDTKEGTLQLLANVLPKDATDKAVTWSVESGAEFASVSDTGVVTAKANGSVIVKAASIANPDITATIELVISNQTIDISLLENLLDVAKAMSNVDGSFTEASFTTLLNTIADAEAEMDNIQTQTELEEQLAKLQAAMDGLEASEPDSDPVDVTELEELLSIAKGMINDDRYYTEASFQALQVAIKQVEEAVETITTESDLQVLIAELQVALKGLEVADPNPEEDPEAEEPVDEDQDYETEGSTDDESAQEKEKQNDKEQDQTDKGEKLPDTATSVHTLLLLGVTMLLLSALTMPLVYRKK
ncbi:family 43 glycosylhydrolase [Gracilibacillus massiliensis]|uniref:family 43 glycosylhydrolase n=1 Tax=Gracilibacillus massiliensis TaxID=1564956 RepID=UPI00071D5779|nr:family 43 glycosylhydrolase [Gracilibacillus massiliensis]